MTHPLLTLLTVPLAIALTIPTTTSPPTVETLHQLGAVSATQQTHAGPYTLTP